MITLTISIATLGFYAWYYTSSKAEINNRNFLFTLASNNKVISKLVSISLMITAFILILNSNSLGITSLMFILMTSLIANCVTMLSPLNILNYKTLIVLIVISTLLETTI